MKKPSMRQRKKELKFKREMRHAVMEIDKNINGLTREITNIVKTAAEAKQAGLTTQYNKAVNNLRFCMNTRVKYISLKMDLKMALELRNSMQIMQTFAYSMNKWSKSISKITKDFDINEVMENVDAANEIIEEKNAELDDLTTTISQGYGNIVENDKEQIVSNDEAIKIIDSYIVGGKSSKPGVDSENDLDRIRKMLDGDKKE